MAEGAEAAEPVVVRAGAAHAAEARDLLEEYYSEIGVVKRDAPDAIEALLSEPRAGFWIAYIAGMAAGCVLLRPLEGRDASAECKRLYVRSCFRRRGVAEALLQALEDFAVESGYRCLYLDSKDDLQAALALYRGRGYQACERYNDNPQATVFLRKSLPCPRR